MQPEFPPRLEALPRPLVFVRTLEAFEGDILSEHRAQNGSGIYLEKWCARQGNESRSLIVRAERRPIAEYLGGRISMLRLLTESSDGVGFLVDRRGGEIVSVFHVVLSVLPAGYLPMDDAFHDESLRPNWNTVPQNFLLDESWDAKVLAGIEREYLDVFSFAYFTKPGAGRRIPEGILQYEFDGGYPLMHVNNKLRKAIPRPERARSVSVAANSPGVLTIDAPVVVADHLAEALKAVYRSRNLYDSLHEWSKLKPGAVDMMPEITAARTSLNHLCNALGVDASVLLPITAIQNPEPIQILVAGKLVASYYRKLWKLLKAENGAEFVSVSVEEVDDSEVAPAGVIEGEDDDILS